MALEIRSTGLPTRCEVCHQIDLFDPSTLICQRCQDIAFSYLPAPTRQKSPVILQILLGLTFFLLGLGYSVSLTFWSDLAFFDGPLTIGIFKMWFAPVPTMVAASFVFIGSVITTRWFPHLQNSPYFWVGLWAAVVAVIYSLLIILSGMRVILVASGVHLTPSLAKIGSAYIGLGCFILWVTMFLMGRGISAFHLKKIL